jgi:flagellar biosynthesis/type III secretory pathway M-ring protein FliF/YscJ
MAPTIAHQFDNIFFARRDDSSSIPQAPPATSSYTSSNNSGWSPSAIIGIVAAIVLILIMVPLIAIILRRYERKRCLEMLPKDGPSPRLGSSNSSVREDQSLKSILVTREVQRSSLRVAGRAEDGVKRPEEAHMSESGWSRTEVRGGDWR